MDVSLTAQTLPVVQAALDTAKAAGLTPDQLMLAAGVVYSHVANSIAPRIPEALRPVAIAAVGAASTAGVALLNGASWSSALGYGLGSAAVSKLYHTVVFNPKGLLSVLASLAAKPSDQATAK